MRQRSDEFVFRPIRFFKFQGPFLYPLLELRGLFTQRVFSFAAPRHVTRNFRKTSKFPFLVVQSGNYNVGPESRSVFTHAASPHLQPSLQWKRFQALAGVFYSQCPASRKTWRSACQ